MRRAIVSLGLGLVLALAMLGGASAASGYTYAGNSVINRPHVDGWQNIYQVDMNRPFSADGDVKEWEIYAKNTNQVQLVIYRNSGGWSVVGKSELKTPVVGYNRFTLGSAISVRAGDYIGLYFPGAGSVAFGESGSSRGVRQTLQGAGETNFSLSLNRIYSVRAGSVIGKDYDGPGNGLGKGHYEHGNGLGIGHLHHGDGVGRGHIEND